jgi:hypothetical protein
MSRSFSRVRLILCAPFVLFFLQHSSFAQNTIYVPTDQPTIQLLSNTGSPSISRSQ